MTSYQTIQTLFEQHRLHLNAAEAHGLAVAILCVREQADVQLWLHELVSETDEFDEQEQLDLAQLFKQTRMFLTQDQGFSFDLLLPDEERALPERAEALRCWCDGFLLGIGYHRPNRQWSAQCNDIIRDIAAFSQLDSAAAVGEDDDVALTEIREYLRAAVFMLKEPLNAMKDQPGTLR